MSTREWSAPKWVNSEPDAGAVGALLSRLAGHIAPATLDELWLFPTRRGGGVESTVFVLATFTEDAERRDVLTARFTVSRDRKGRATVEQRIDSHATAPVAAVGRVVEGVLRRLGDDAAQPPRLEQLGGNEERFRELVVELGGTAETEDSTSTSTSISDSNSNSNSNENQAEQESATDPASAPDSVPDSTPDSTPDSAPDSDPPAAAEGVARGEGIGYQ